MKQRMQAEQFAKELARIAAELKSEDVALLDLRGLTSITDFLVIATGSSDRQMHAVVDHLREYGQRVGEKVYGLDGADSDRWILVDFVDVVVHLFSREARDYYDMDLLWGDAPRLAWARSETA